MADFLYSIDLSIFYFINHSIVNPLFDKFFVFITEAKNWFIAYVILWFICFFKGGRIGKIAAVLTLILITVSDQLSSFVIKNLFERIRPCNTLPDVRILAGCSNSYSFPSSHAVNNFAAAVFFYKIYPKLKWILFIIAFLIALSRVYVGRHYPSDILGGAVIGSAIGYVFAFIALQIDKYLLKKLSIKNN
jgi:undecaprenyl-diphosphatase